ncbi:NAD(+) diphosphatase [Gordonia sp. TBRC 11910]|uniref:NAD(+) diphosphatase n=1 Tax=Gordonia asplenii TaxID=2725283 RepID=A0A848KV41_9ACTN|nr:NAD(+) diphosphatase [Gordonia asplenii]NMO01907.1 NAD(+) diphosphatase [Gordonia asplenii]
MSFVLPAPPMLSRATFDRAHNLREDPAALAAGWGSALVLDVDYKGRYPITGDGHLRWAAASGDIDDSVALLGVDGGVHKWARRVSEVVGERSDPRLGAINLDPDEAGLLATALGMLNWHDTSRFSPSSGRETRSDKAGWVRRDVDTGREEFPRTDAAIITVVHDGGDRVLLGRQAAWPDRWYSTLAGFVEPGESLEQCVAREIYEEVGIQVHSQRYLGSQPWPFPRSLMCGFAAIADPDEPLRFLDGEIGDAVWFHRDEVREALARGDDWVRVEGAENEAPTEGPRLRLPGSISIARALIEAWAA